MLADTRNGKAAISNAILNINFHKFSLLESETQNVRNILEIKRHRKSLWKHYILVDRWSL